MQRTLLDKIWDAHVVTGEQGMRDGETNMPLDSQSPVPNPGSPAVLYIDLHLVHEVTSPQAFQMLRERGYPVRRPDRTIATVDHSIPTHDRSLPVMDAQAARQIQQLVVNCRDFGIPLYDPQSGRQGIVHVIGPEQGLTQPGMTIVCGDSHTATHGAFGALAFGIGTSEVAHVLASQCLLQHKPKTFRVHVTSRLKRGVTAKDIILALIAQIGVGGGTGHVFEYTGEAIRSLSMDERMTVCNMSIEGGARAGLVAPDDTTFQYLSGRPFAPQGPAWDAAVARWRELPTDPDAGFDRSVTLDGSNLDPMITFGTNPAMGIPITSPVPDPESATEPAQRRALEKALAYMGLRPGRPLLGHGVDVVFIGSCTNGRLSDLRQAAQLMEGRKVHPAVRTLVVPGSMRVKADAESEGLDRIFKSAGCEWREPGCSMCIAMNGDQLSPGQYAISTSNRNFEGRQGPGGRTFLASPLTAAAAAITGHVTDPRTMIAD